ncbi:MAG TPA: hypothetical protein VFV38_31845, partial [Ktedonobacteraceae bacterium]|nr:hypothetical protein [Ktedonobacteraceae bacterium]
MPNTQFIARQSVAQQHAAWLSLVEIAGPFLSVPVLQEYFPHGLDIGDDDAQVRHRTSLAYE